MARKSNNSPTNILFSGQEKPVSKIISPSQIHKTTSQQILKPLMIDPSIKTSALTPIHFYKPQLISNLSVVTSSTPISFKAPCSPLPSAFARKTSFYDNLPAQLVASNSNTTVNPVKKESPLRMSIELTKQPIRSTWQLMQSPTRPSINGEQQKVVKRDSFYKERIEELKKKNLTLGAFLKK